MYFAFISFTQYAMFPICTENGEQCHNAMLALLSMRDKA